MERTIGKMLSTYGTIFECYPLQEAHELLVANNFLDEETIRHVIEHCDQEAWDYIRTNRYKYAPRVRDMIHEFDPPLFSKTKLRVVELTDKKLEEYEKQERMQKEKDFEPIWDSMKETIAQRPMDELDDMLDVAWETLQKARERMTTYLSSKKKRYIPPSMRNQVDTEQQEIEHEIDRCQMEFDNLEKRILNADEKYTTERKNEEFQKWLCQV